MTLPPLTSRTLCAWLMLFLPVLRAQVAPEPLPAPGNLQIQVQGGGAIRIEGNRDGVIVIPGGVQPVEKDVKFGYLGVLLEDLGLDEIDEAKENRGASISRVVDGSPAALAGLVEGDRVMMLDGNPVKNSAAFRETIRAGKPGQAVKMTVRRGGKEVEVKGKLGTLPENAGAFPFGVQLAASAVPGVVVFYRGAGAESGAQEAAAGESDSVLLRDGNRLAGRVQSVDSERGVLLQRADAPAVELIGAEIEALTFASRAKAALPPAKTILALRDGSWFGGDSLVMEQGKISLNLPGGQRLSVPREQAQWITLSEGLPPQTYEGPLGLAGWTSGRGSAVPWEYRDGFLRGLTNTPVMRNIERMPDPLDLSFDVLYPASAQVFSVALFAGTSETAATPGSLTIQFQPQSIQANHFDGLRFNQYRAAAPAVELGEAGNPVTTRYRLLVDRVNGELLVFVNGVKRGDWKLSKVKPEDLGKCAPGLVFTPQIFNSVHAFQIGRIHLRPWDGQIPADGAEPAEVREDQVFTAHAAKTGRIERITGQQVVLANQPAIARREKPLFLRFAEPARPAAEAVPAKALLRLKQGGEFSVQAIRSQGENVVVQTRLGAELTLPVASLRSVEFYPRSGPPDAGARGRDVLTLTDGTRVKGRLVTPLEGDSLRWKIAAAKGALEFPMKAVAGVLLPRTDSTPATGEGAGAVQMANGDWLPGALVSLDANQLVLGSNVSPALSLPASSVRDVYVSPEIAASIADGASGAEPWSAGWNPEGVVIDRGPTDRTAGLQESWTYFDGAYSLASAPRFGVVGLAHKWPVVAGAFAVNLEVDGAELVPAFQMQLFNGKDQPSINLYCPGNGRVYLGFNTLTNKLNGQRFGNREFRLTKPREKKLRVTLVLDRPAKTFRVIFDDQEVGKVVFKEEDAAALDAGGLSITPQGGRRLCRFGKLWLAPWPGPLSPQSAVAAEKAPEIAPEQVLYLTNGDEAAGRGAALDANLVTLETEVGPLAVPAQRVAWMHFRGPDAAPAEDTVRLRFHDRGVLSVRKLHIAEDRVTCQTVYGQALDFPLALLKELVWQPLP